jgi:serine/threonine-protein kinase
VQSASSPILADRWQLIELLGQGAMGEVWRGRHVLLGHEVAIKLMRPEAATDSELVARFRREARIAAQLRHRNLVRVEDLGSAPDGRPFLVMELLRGESLARLLERNRRLDAPTVVRIVTHIAAACDVAHGAGIVHRDLKPDNCFVVIDDDGLPLVKVLDFGVAKVADGMFKTTASPLTGTNSLLGTPIYMSPEQARGQADLDGRSDLWSLGIIAYELLTGRLPYQATNLSQLLFAVLSASIPPPSAYDPSLGSHVDAWFAQALERERTRRFQNGRELAGSLARALGVALPSNSLTPPVIDRAHAFPVSAIGPTAVALASHPPGAMSPATMTAPTSEIGAIDTQKFAQPGAPPSMRPSALASSPPPPMAGAVYDATGPTAYAMPRAAGLPRTEAIPMIAPTPALPRTEAIPMPMVMPPAGQGYSSAPHASFGPNTPGHSGFAPVPRHAPPFQPLQSHPTAAAAPSSTRVVVATLTLGIVAGMFATGTVVMVQRRRNHRAAITRTAAVAPSPAAVNYPTASAIPATNATVNTTVVDAAVPHVAIARAPSPVTTHGRSPAATPSRAARAAAITDATATDAGSHTRAGNSSQVDHSAESPSGEQPFDGP